MDKYTILIWAFGVSVASLGSVIWWAVNRIVRSLDNVDDSVRTLALSNMSHEKDIESIKEDSHNTKNIVSKHAEQIEELKIHIASCQKRLK